MRRQRRIGCTIAWVLFCGILLLDALMPKAAQGIAYGLDILVVGLFIGIQALLVRRGHVLRRKERGV